jgi:polyhydroxyalkanoate synthase subunit PhaC
MVRRVGERDPGMARAALEGLAAYERAPRPEPRPQRPVAAQVGPAVLRDHGGEGPCAILVPSLINPPRILDLDEEVSLAAEIARTGRRALLLDWGPARERAELDIGGHVENLLVPLLGELGEASALVGYCLGGTMTIAAANLALVERVATIASPWSFAGYSDDSRASLLSLWRQAEPAARSLNLMPMEVLQAAFWSLDPTRTVSKFARLSTLDPVSGEARRFVALEEWANEGEALPLPAARELMEDLFDANLPGSGKWSVGGKAVIDRLDVAVLNLVASKDRITPSASAPAGARLDIRAGHVGMVVGSARSELHRALAAFLDPACR